MQVKRVSVEDDLKKISRHINNAHWDEQNEMDEDGFNKEHNQAANRLDRLRENAEIIVNKVAGKNISQQESDSTYFNFIYQKSPAFFPSLALSRLK